jgi:cellulose synthase/poly-beta-1,6-N-acetylglucosamine synthase-like glycosyltransferase
VDIGGAWGQGRLFQLLDGTRDVRISHNTAFHTGSIVFGGDSRPHEGFVFTDNIVQHNEYGITGSGTGPGNESLRKYFPEATVRRNLIVGGSASRYPDDNHFPSSMKETGLMARPDGSFDLELARPYAGAGSDGLDPGADVPAILAAMKRVESVRARAAATERPDRLEPAVAGLGWTPPAALVGPPDAALVFWISFALLVYVYAGYPLVAWVRAHVFPRRRIRAPIEPSVSLVVVAYNEADRIVARIENLLALDYPADKLEILIGSDGSIDATAARAWLFEEAGVKVHAFRERRGKPAVINELVAEAAGEIVVLGDARQAFDPSALRALVSHFADPDVGAVSGELVLEGERDGSTASRGAGFYWRYEKFIRASESRASSTVGATGAIYAFRRELFEPVPADTILDDVLIPMRIARSGRAVLFEPAARAYDTVSATAQQEYVRKVRTIAGTFQLFAREPWLLSPARNPLWFETISHKGLRLALPALHASLLTANFALTEGWIFQLAMGAQLCFYGAALGGHALRHARRRPLLLAVPYAMCLLIWAIVAGFGRFLAHRQRVTWERIEPRGIGLKARG